jgi:hypothetical protein
MRKFLMLSLVLLAAGCTIAQRPEFDQRYIIRGSAAISTQRVAGLTIGYYDIDTDAMKFIKPDIAVGVHVGDTAEHTRFGSTTVFEIGPCVMMVLDLQKGGLVPYGYASLGIVDSAIFGAAEDGQYASFQGGGLFFLSEKWALDCSLKFLFESVENYHAKTLTLGFGLSVLFDDAGK